jgi:hypothetical protein
MSQFTHNGNELCVLEVAKEKRWKNDEKVFFSRLLFRRKINFIMQISQARSSVIRQIHPKELE